MNDSPTHEASRWIINFRDWPLSPIESQVASLHFASDFPDLLAIVRRDVKPLRETSNRKVYREKWWHFGERRVELYEKLKERQEVLAVASAATKYIEFAVVPANVVFGHSVAVIVQDDMAVFAILTSDIHKSWVREYASYNLSLIRYTPSDCLETFPFPAHMSGLRTIGQQYKDWRSEVMLRNDEGLTKTLNRLHSPGEHNAAIERLRRLQVELDQAVLNAYGFADCELGHGFHDTKQGIRFTISLAARQEILRRLLKLNHERYAAEVAAGLHEKSTKKNPKSKKSDDDIETDPNVQLGIRRHLFDDQLILGELYVE